MMRAAAGIAKNKDPAAPESVAVLVFPEFPLMAFSAVIEPLRAANVISGRRLYKWLVVSLTECAVSASNGVSITPDHSAASAPLVDRVVVCSGGNADRIDAPEPLKWIRRILRAGGSVGSVADGAFYLARGGLLDGFACTLHWRSQPAFAETFPDIDLGRSIYVIDRTRFTSAGGIGAFDMMLDLIGQQHGEDLARRVSEWFVHDRIRNSADRERLQLRLRTGIRDDLVLAAVAQFEIDNEHAAPVATIAQRLGVSIEKLERAFRAELGVTPIEHYKHIRLQRARDLLEHSAMPVREIGLAAGYSSFSAFIRAFRQIYGKTPRQLREKGT